MEINALKAELKEQASQIQKVSAQFAAASPSRGGLEASETRRKWFSISRKIISPPKNAKTNERKPNYEKSK